MKKNKLDETDLSLIRCLSQDGRMPVKELSEQLQVTPPTVYARIKNLIGAGVMKIVGLVDLFNVGNVQSAIVAINVNDDSKLPEIMDRLVEFAEVQWAVAVILEESMEALFKFHTEKLSSLEGVANSESFVIMKTKNKWFSLSPDTLNSGGSGSEGGN